MQNVIYRFGPYELRARTREVYKDGIRLKVRPQPFQVLLALVARSGDIVTRSELQQLLWPAETFVDFEHGLNTAIKELRGLLNDSASAPRYVETLPKLGYRMIAQVEAVEPRLRDSSSEAVYAGRQERFNVGEIHAVAVLPLEDLSGEPGRDYFADGITEALITSLAKIKALRVISRTSAMQYKGARKSLPRIARELNVDAVIEGSVVRSGERVRIAAQLIQASSDHHLWAETYERDSRDILSLQSEIAREIANQVRIVLTPEEEERLGIARSVDPEAHELYLKARYFWNKRTEESVRKALAYFLRAIDREPTYAQGYAGLADSYNVLGYYNALPPTEAYSKAKAAAFKALELDDSLAEPHAALGVVKRDFEWDWCGAKNEFQRAIELNPGYVESYHWRATLLSMLGQHAEAIHEKNRALTLDPLSVVIRSDLARMFYYHRDYDHALDHYRAALEMDPNHVFAHIWLSHVYEQKGQFEQAISELENGMRLAGDSPFALAKLGHGYALAGRWDEARVVLNRLHVFGSRRYVSPYDVAMIHVGLQENEQAFEWLQRAVEERSLWLGYLNVEPQLDSLRSDPRFQELLGHVGLLNDFANEARYIETLPKVGYRVIARVTRAAPLHAAKEKDAGTPVPSVAVLPFVNLSADPENEFFADGITEDVITHLAKIKSLKTISRTSVMTFKKRDCGLREIGERLGATTLLEGSVRRTGSRVRIVAQLVDGATDEHLWAETYDRDLTDIFAIQTDVALKIATALRAELSHDERSRVGRRPTDDLAAYELYSRGRNWFYQFTEEGYRRSLLDYHAAVDRDPGFALAWVGIAGAYAELCISGSVGRSPEETIVPAKKAAGRAREIDHELGEAHGISALIQFAFDFDWAGAERSFLRAIELSPGSAQTHQHYGWLCSSLGRHDDALRQIRRARELDPLLIPTDLVPQLLRAGRIGEALAEARKSAREQPGTPRCHSALGWALIFSGEETAGIASLERAVALSPGATLFLSQLGQACALTGNVERARQILDEMRERSTREFISPYHLAYVYAGLGEADAAIDCLEQAFERRSGAIHGIKGSFLFRNLRDHPRFESLLRRMNLS